MEFFSTSNIFAPGNGQKDTDELLLRAIKMRVFACTITSDLKIFDIKNITYLTHATLFAN